MLDGLDSTNFAGAAHAHDGADINAGQVGEAFIDAAIARDVEVLGLVPADDKTITAANRGIPVVHDKKAISGAAFLRIAARVDGDEVPLAEFQPKSGLFSKFKGLVGINGSSYSHA